MKNQQKMQAFTNLRKVKTLAPDQTEESKELELPGLAVDNQRAQMYGFLSDY